MTLSPSTTTALKRWMLVAGIAGQIWFVLFVLLVRMPKIEWIDVLLLASAGLSIMNCIRLYRRL